MSCQNVRTWFGEDTYLIKSRKNIICKLNFCYSSIVLKFKETKNNNIISKKLTTIEVLLIRAQELTIAAKPIANPTMPCTSKTLVDTLLQTKIVTCMKWNLCSIFYYKNNKIASINDLLLRSFTMKGIEQMRNMDDKLHIPAHIRSVKDPLFSKSVS